MINLRKLADQQKNQRALKSKNRILKQTHDIRLEENLSPKAEELEEVKDSTPKLEEIVKDSNAPQPAIESTHNAIPIEFEEIHTCVRYDTSLENTLSNMKQQKGFFIIKEADNDDIIWNGFPFEKIGGKKLKGNEKVYDINDDLQNVSTNTSNIPLKKLNDKDEEIYKDVLESPNFLNYKAIRGETKFAGCK